MMSVTLRPVCPEDEIFLQEVYGCTREQEMALVPWDETQKDAFIKMQFAAQQRDYSSRFPEARHSIIVVDDVSVGRLYVAEIEDAIKILDITVLPSHRSRGVGSFLIKELCAAATAARKPLRIYVDGFSPSLRFFERAGFSRIGESGFSQLMQWSPDH
jgi:GNAT superfamily N-acetyltransferase